LSSGHRLRPDRRLEPIALLGVTFVGLCARPALAQDITVLVVALGPPVVVTPVVLAAARWSWLRRFATATRFLPLLAVSCLEVLLWAVVVGSVLIVMTGEWQLRTIVWPAVAGVALWLVSGIWVDRSHKLARWFFFASPPIVLVLLLVITWSVIVATGV